MEAKKDQSYNIETHELGKEMFEQLDEESKKFINEKKEDGREIFIYKFENDQIYVFRGISFLEYKRLQKGEFEDEKDYIIELVHTALLYPQIEKEKVGHLTAGEVSNLAEFISYASHFNTNAEIYQL